MFGNNQLVGKAEGDGSLLLLHEIFGTIQGEGPEAGRPAIFIRLAGCNLRCFFCDTDFESVNRLTPLDEIVTEVETQTRTGLCNASLVVITGGEPMRQQIGPLVRRLLRLNYDVQIETAGTLWPEGFEEVFDEQASEAADGWRPRYGRLSIVCSPKTGKVHRFIEQYTDAFKYIVRNRDPRDEIDGLPLASTQTPGEKTRIYRGDHSKIWLQPCEEYYHVVAQRPEQAAHAPDRAETRINMELAAKLCIKHGYRLSLQLHKMIGLP